MVWVSLLTRVYCIFLLSSPSQYFKSVLSHKIHFSIHAVLVCSDLSYFVVSCKFLHKNEIPVKILDSFLTLGSREGCYELVSVNVKILIRCDHFSL